MRIRILLHDLLHQDVHFLLSLPTRHARPEPPIHIEPGSLALVKPTPAGGDNRIHDQRNPEVRTQPGHAPLKNGRGDSDNSERMLIDINGPADDGRVPTEMGLPQAIADYHHRRAFRLLFFRRQEAAAQDGPHTEHVEVVRGDQHPQEALRLAAAGEGQGVADVIAEESGKAPVPLP